MTLVSRGVETDEHSDVAFGKALEKYKDAGNNTLVVGTLPQTVAQGLSRTHLGAPDERRYRLLALTHPDLDAAARRLPNEGSEAGHTDRTTVLTYSTAARGGTATERPERGVGPVGPAEPSFPCVDLDSGDGSDLRSFRRSLFDEIRALRERSGGPFDPAQLRVSLDGLEPLLGMYGAPAVESFVDDLTTHVRDHRGMGQFFLSYPRDHPVVTSLERQFEIVITVDELPGGAHAQTWDLREFDIQKRIPLQTD